MAARGYAVLPCLLFHHCRTPLHTRITVWLCFDTQSGIAPWPHTDSHADYSLAVLCAQSCITQRPNAALHADYRLDVLYCAVGHRTTAARRFTRRLPLGCALLRNRALHNGRAPLYTRIIAWLCFAAQSDIAQRPHVDSHADYLLAALCCAIGHCTMAARRFTRGLPLGRALMRSRVSKLSTHSAQPHVEAQSYRTRAPPPACAALYPRTNAKTRTFRFKRNDAGRWEIHTQPSALRFQ